MPFGVSSMRGVPLPRGAECCEIRADDVAMSAETGYSGVNRNRAGPRRRCAPQSCAILPIGLRSSPSTTATISPRVREKRSASCSLPHSGAAARHRPAAPHRYVHGHRKGSASKRFRVRRPPGTCATTIFASRTLSPSGGCGRCADRAYGLRHFHASVPQRRAQFIQGLWSRRAGTMPRVANFEEAAPSSGIRDEWSFRGFVKPNGCARSIRESPFSPPHRVEEIFAPSRDGARIGIDRVLSPLTVSRCPTFRRRHPRMLR